MNKIGTVVATVITTVTVRENTIILSSSRAWMEKRQPNVRAYATKLASQWLIQTLDNTLPDMKIKRGTSVNWPPGGRYRSLNDGITSNIAIRRV